MTDRPRYPRSSCCVPFCRRTSTLFGGEWICGDHWRLVDGDLKRFWRRQMRKLCRAWEAADARYEARRAQLAAEADPRGVHVDDPVWALRRARGAAGRRWRAADRVLWGRIKRQAITRAAEAPL